VDLVASEAMVLAPGARASVGTGIELAIPEGYEGQVRPRSGLALRHGVTVLNAPGTIDSDYRGEIRVLLINHGETPFSIEVGDRIAQLVVTSHCTVTFALTTELDRTQRGEGGFGHTGVAHADAAGGPA
jgi:dUTP pyrophosphatase